MEIEYKTGDLFAGSEQVVIHGCNQRGVFGSGFASSVRRLCPEVRQAYLDHHARHGLTIGDVIWAPCGVRTIGNAITQADYGREPGRVYVDYDAIRTAMIRTNAMVYNLRQWDADFGPHPALGPVDRVAMPLIGCGLAGGSWKIVSEIISQESICFTPVVYLLDGIIPTT